MAGVGGFFNGSGLAFHIRGYSTTGFLLPGTLIFGRTALSGSNPFPDLDTAPSETIVPFRFGSPVEDLDGNTYLFDPYHRVHRTSANGREILLDGFTRNKEFDGDNLIWLEIEAPQTVASINVVTGTATMTGSYYYIYRYVNSTLDKRSGFSPVSAVAVTTNENVEVTVTGSDDPQVDKVDIYRNLDGDQEGYFYVATIDNPATTDTYTDVATDTDIEDNEIDSLVEGKTFNEGIMYPHTKSLYHLGYVWYYGLERMKQVSGSSVAVTNGDQTVTFTGFKLKEARRGQKFKVSGDDTEYRIIYVDETGNTAEVYPAIERANGSGLTFTISDDRDGRRYRISVPGRPGSIPTYHDGTLGTDLRDDIMAMFVIGTTTFAVTKKKIYQFYGERNTEPWFTITAAVVFDEGVVGPDAWCVVPGVGFIYVDDLLGVRLFTGDQVVYLGPFPTRNEILGEWRRFNPAKIPEILLAYDERGHQVIVSYARDSESGLTHQMVFDITRRIWVGPWTRRVNSYGQILDPLGGLRQVFGSDMGVLFQDYLGNRDGYSSDDVEGTLTAISGQTYSDTNASLKTSGEGLYGALVEFQSPSKTQTSVAYIASNTGTTFNVLTDPNPAPEVGWTFRIAPIWWLAMTGFIDLLQVGEVKELEEVRWRQPIGSKGTMRTLIALNGGSLQVLSAADSDEVSLTDAVYLHQRIKERATVFQVALSGSNESGNPQITHGEAILDIRGGMENE